MQGAGFRVWGFDSRCSLIKKVKNMMDVSNFATHFTTQSFDALAAMRDTDAPAAAAAASLASGRWSAVPFYVSLLPYGVGFYVSLLPYEWPQLAPSWVTSSERPATYYLTIYVTYYVT